MPNNNPQGHNQYTKRENRSQRAATTQQQSNAQHSTKSDDEENGNEVKGSFADDLDKARQAGRKGGETHGSNH